MKELLVENSNGKNVKFVGKVIAFSATDENRASSYFSGRCGEWDEYRVYETKDGKYIVSIENKTLWAGHSDNFSAMTFEDKNEILGYFGYSDLAKDIYYQLGINCEIEIA